MNNSNTTLPFEVVCDKSSGKINALNGFINLLNSSSIIQGYLGDTELYPSCQIPSHIIAELLGLDEHVEFIGPDD